MMNRLNWIFTLSSLNLILVSVERFSFTTQILLQPYNFLRLHELIQMTMLILFTVVLPVFLLREVTNNFSLIKQKSGFALLLVFIIGIYFYATGNGVHEVSSFNFNNFCDTKKIADDLCGSFFINDYYTGNILYFIGAVLMSVPLLLLERRNPSHSFTKKQQVILVVNAVIYSLAIFAYAAFDRVWIGFIYSAIMALIAFVCFWPIRKQHAKYPVTSYTTLSYLIGFLFSFLYRVL